MNSHELRTKHPFRVLFTPFHDATWEVKVMENAEVAVRSPVVMFTIRSTYSNKLQWSYGRGKFKASIQKSSFLEIYTVGYRTEFSFQWGVYL